MAIVYKYFAGSRLKYLCRVWLNNFKNIKAEGVTTGYYVLLGGLAFLKLHSRLAYTPVSPQVQEYYIQRFGSVKPVFGKIIQKFTSR